MMNETGMSDRRTALRRALIASAERMIDERGHQALRARELAQDVGCALGAIYNVFPDLDALILAVKAQTLDDLEAEIARRFATTNAAAEQPTDAAKRALQTLAQIYLAFASRHTRRWQTLFEHRSPNAGLPEAYAAKIEGILGHIERPLETIAPSAGPAARRLFARALLSAVHGVVARGLDENLGPLPAESLSWQVRALVEAAASGVADHPEIVTMAGAA